MIADNHLIYSVPVLNISERLALMVGLLFLIKNASPSIRGLLI